MFTPERLAVSAFYGALMMITLVLAWRSRSAPLLETSVWIAVAWVADSIAFYLLGPKFEPYVAPSIDAAVAAMIGFCAWKHRSWAALLVVLAFFLSATVAVASFLNHDQGSRLYFAMGNVTFALRLMVVWGASLHAMAVGSSGRLRRHALHRVHRAGHPYAPPKARR